MKMKGGGGVLVVMMVMVWGVSAIPTITSQPLRKSSEPVEEEPVVDALGEWLAHFDTYTFMVQQEVESKGSSISEDVLEQDSNVLPDDGDINEVPEEEEEVEEGGVMTPEDEEMEEDEESTTNAPIIVSVGERGLLNPHIDYLVTVESLVAEEGSVLLTLSRFTNKSDCGVGGFSQDGTIDLNNLRMESRVDIEHPKEDINTTIVAFSHSEIHSNAIVDGSQWEEVSDEFWWASGKLVGGGLLALTFIPPECGCLTLSTYYALPVGTLTLVVGPQAYPTKLQQLLCIDPSPKDLEIDEGIEEAAIGEPLDVANTLGVTTEASDTEDENIDHPLRGHGGKNRRRKGRKRARARQQLGRRRKQLRRQQIRQAGRRNVRQELRQDRGQRNRTGNHRNRNNGRRGRKGPKKWHHKKKYWKKFAANTTDLDNSTQAANFTSGSHTEESSLIDVLLQGTESNNFTVGENSLNDIHDELERDEAESSDGLPEQDKSVTEMPETVTRKGHRMNRRQRKKWKRRQTKKNHTPGVKFCCKQGVKHKKYLLIINNTIDAESSATTCNTSGDVVPTFANYQFGMTRDECASMFSRCCSNFTADLWESIKAKKTARKTAKKQRKQAQRQNRKHQKKERRKHRMERRRQNQQDFEYEAGEERHPTPESDHSILN